MIGRRGLEHQSKRAAGVLEQREDWRNPARLARPRAASGAGARHGPQIERLCRAHRAAYDVQSLAATPLIDLYKSSCTLCPMIRRISISDARRLLPQLVREVAADGGRVDITYRGNPQVSLMRVSDVKGSGEATASKRRDALMVELAFGAESLLAAIREVRRANVPRLGPLASEPQPGVGARWARRSGAESAPA